MDAVPLFHALLALALVILTAGMTGTLFGRFGQPPVMGEIVGGILLGPSLLGSLWPAAHATLLPASIVPFLALHAQVGIILYMFLIGLELDLDLVRKSGYATLAISHVGIVVPFVLGLALAFWLHPELAPAGASFGVFALFLGVSMSITAFPVLARILADCGLSRTRLGTIALACAAVDDASAWCLLALVTATAQARASDAIVTAALALAFVGFMIRIAAPAIRRLTTASERNLDISLRTLSGILAAVLASAAATEWIGLHGLFGAFLLGAIIPHSSRMAASIHVRLQPIVGVLFLPVFFAFTGMRTEIGLIRGIESWTICAAIVLVACAGKLGGCLLAARVTGLGWRDSAALGILMNTRGLVELIVLNIGLDLQIISPRLFTMLVIMALVTTFMTTPVLQRLLREEAAAPTGFLTPTDPSR
jgi:Kef-type K+ transport system membrane component KefB